MTTFVTRSDPRTTVSNDAEPALREPAERTAAGWARSPAARIGLPLLAPAGVIQMGACHPQQPTPAGGVAGIAGMVAHLIGTIGEPAGYCAGNAVLDRVGPGATGAPPRNVAPPLSGSRPAPAAVASTSTHASATAKTSTAAKGSTAAKTSTSAKTSTTASRTLTTSASKATAKELAFLSDKNLSIEEKLFRFIALMTKKGDQELVDAMKSYEARKSAATKSASTSGAAIAADAAPVSSPPSSGGGGGGGFLGGIFGGIGDAVGGVLKDAGGPLLAAATTAVGFPELAPLAMSAGSALGGLVAGDTVGRSKSGSGSSSSANGSTATTATKTSTSGSTSASDTGAFDEKVEMLNLQFMAEKQTAMFNALSNVMKSIHDTQMTAVQNIR